MDYNTVRANRRRAVVGRYKKMKGCVDCRYSEHAAALEFDHRPETNKNKTVASLMYQSWEVIKREIAKCEVVCANCHAIRSAKRGWHQ